MALGLVGFGLGLLCVWFELGLVWLGLALGSVGFGLGLLWVCCGLDMVWFAFALGSAGFGFGLLALAWLRSGWSLAGVSLRSG